MLSPLSPELPIIPFPASSECASNPNVVGFHLTSSNTKTPKDPQWNKMVKAWRREQLERARIRLKYRSVFRQLLTSLRFAAPPTNASPPMTIPTTTTTPPRDSSTSYLRDMLAKYSQTLSPPQLGRRSRKYPCIASPLTKKTTTRTKKTTKMLQQYRLTAKMPKGWVHVVVEDDGEDEVDEVWEKQKEALSASTTHGSNGAWGPSAVSRL